MPENCRAGSREAWASHLHLQSDTSTVRLPSCRLHWDTIRLLKLNTLCPKLNSRFSVSNLLLSHFPNLSTWKALCVPFLGPKSSSFFLSHPTSNPSKILLALLLNVTQISTSQQLHCYHLSPSLCHLLQPPEGADCFNPSLHRLYSTQP